MSVENYFLKYYLWEKDEEKRKNALNHGYIVEYLWESDIIKMSDDDIYNKIINFLNIRL